MSVAHRKKARFCFVPKVMMMGSTSVAQVLLTHGANPNVADRSTRATPLHDVARTGFLDTVLLLVEAGADPQARDNADCLPIDLARQNGHTDVVAFLETLWTYACLHMDHYLTRLVLIEDRKKAQKALIFIYLLFNDIAYNIAGYDIMFYGLLLYICEIKSFNCSKMLLKTNFCREYIFYCRLTPEIWIFRWNFCFMKNFYIVLKAK